MVTANVWGGDRLSMAKRAHTSIGHTRRRGVRNDRTLINIEAWHSKRNFFSIFSSDVMECQIRNQEMLCIAERASVLASSITASGTKAGGRVGIYAPNCPNWMLIIQACNRSSLYVGESACPPLSCTALQATMVSREQCWQLISSNLDGHLCLSG